VESPFGRGLRGQCPLDKYESQVNAVHPVDKSCFL
jgi:hypothetical protein